MIDLLIEILEEKFHFPIFRQGSFSEDEQYPDYFFTYWDDSSYTASSYDNSTASITYDFNICFYGVNPDLVYAITSESIEVLKNNGFFISGDGNSVYSDELTHIGRGFTAQITKYKGELSNG